MYKLEGQHYAEDTQDRSLDSFPLGRPERAEGVCRSGSAQAVAFLLKMQSIQQMQLNNACKSITFLQLPMGKRGRADIWVIVHKAVTFARLSITTHLRCAHAQTCSPVLCSTVPPLFVTQVAGKTANPGVQRVTRTSEQSAVRDPVHRIRSVFLPSSSYQSRQLHGKLPT